MRRKIKAIKLTCDAAKAQMIYGALVARVAYLRKYGDINGIGTEGWREELKAAQTMRDELWDYLTHTRSS